MAGELGLDVCGSKVRVVDRRCAWTSSAEVWGLLTGWAWGGELMELEECFGGTSGFSCRM